MDTEGIRDLFKSMSNREALDFIGIIKKVSSRRLEETPDLFQSILVFDALFTKGAWCQHCEQYTEKRELKVAYRVEDRDCYCYQCSDCGEKTII